ncbi:MAG: four helix bundle protein [Clostridia bacterium]|nr:four helix bundle protein [Clostridia bacterium]
MINKSELYVITKTRDLVGYILTITNKSPKNLRYSYVNRIQEYALNTLSMLVEANECQSNENEGENRKTLQKKSLVELKMLGYLAYLGYEAGAILEKHYKQISLQLDECYKLLKAWIKSDIERNRV